MSVDKVRDLEVGGQKENSKTRNKYILNAYSKAGRVPGTGDAEINKTQSLPSKTS